MNKFYIFNSKGEHYKTFWSNHVNYGGKDLTIGEIAVISENCYYQLIEKDENY